MRTHHWARGLLILAASCGTQFVCAASEDISFVAEHLPEVAMDNRYATLPLPPGGEARTRTILGLGYTSVSSQTLTLHGPMLSLGVSWPRGRWRLTGFAFRDQFSLTSGVEHRPLGLEFTTTPLALPAAAEFTGLDGSMSDTGVGFAVSRHQDRSWIGAFDWSAGLLWQSVSLGDYTLAYQVLDGPDAGATGTISFDSTYNHFTPFAEIGKSHSTDRWRLTPRATIAWPMPRRGVAGSITGPGFELAGNTESTGEGKHFGDPSVTFGCGLTYLPWNVTVDLGATITQAVLEPEIHKGIEQNLVLQVWWMH
jgi:hypothetical protein